MKRKRLLIGLLLTIFGLAIVGYGWLAISQPIADVTTVPVYKAPPVTASNPYLPWPGYGGTALSINNGAVRLTAGSNKPLPTASIAKVMTALAVLDKKPLNGSDPGPSITITADDVASYQAYGAENGSVTAVALGEQITEHQALEAMLLPSANNLADTLARWAFGSLPDYAQYANQKAASLGMKDSYFADASGFSPATVSSPADLVLLGEAVLKNSVLTAITGQATASLPVAGTVYNVNSDLGKNGIFGLKTGNTDQAGGCFLFAAHVTPTGTNQTVTVIGAIMGATNLGTALHDSLAFPASVGNGFAQTTIVKAGTVVSRYQTIDHHTVDAVAKQDITVLHWQGQALTPQLSFKRISNHEPQGATVGTISAQSPFGTAATPVVLAQTIQPPSIWWRLLHPNLVVR